MKKRVILGIVILFFGTICIPSYGMTIEKQIPSCQFLSNIIYVGGNGPNNYTTIQGAINHAQDGDTVFVFSASSPYFEHVIVNKTIHLLGENRTTTIIDGEGSGDVMLLTVDNITVQGFTLQHGGDTPKVNAGIESRSHWNVIQNNIVFQNGRYGVGVLLNNSVGTLVCDNRIAENGNEGIFLGNSTNASIHDNVITGNGHCAIVISKSRGNVITRNTMYGNYAGVSFWAGAMENTVAWNQIHNQEYSGIGMWPGSGNNSIHDNIFSNNALYGFLLTKTSGNVIRNNTIQGSNEGMHLNMANLTLISHNNFLGNNISAYFENSSFNRWRQNYWDDHKGLWPKCIHGQMRIPWNKTRVIGWINFDWLPARKPYDIIFLNEVEQ